MEDHTDDERAQMAVDGPAGQPEDDAIEAPGGVATAGRRLVTEDWAATILGLVLLVLVLGGVIGKGMEP